MARDKADSVVIFRPCAKFMCERPFRGLIYENARLSHTYAIELHVSRSRTNECVVWFMYLHFMPTDTSAPC